MATHVINTLMTAKLSVTSQPFYDVHIFGEAQGTDTAGQVFSIFGGHSAALEPDLESYSLALGKEYGTLSVGGNYYSQAAPIPVSLSSYSFETSQWMNNFAGPFRRGTFSNPLINNYNIFHVTYNQNYDSGAVKFSGGSARLILTAQNGAGNADVYSSASGYNAGNNKLMKTDDGIRLRAEAYGMYSPFDNNAASGTSFVKYNTPNSPVAPNAKSVSYTIYAAPITTEGEASFTARVKDDVHWGYDKKENTLTLEWGDLKAENYNLSAITACEIEYDLYDWHGNRLGETVTVSVAPGDKKLVLENIDPGTRIEWRTRLRQDENSATAWRAYTTHTQALTVVSDLAGRIESTAAALHTGYWDNDDPKDPWRDDSSDREIVAAGVKADTLGLDSNFRASIDARNTQTVFQLGLEDAQELTPKEDDPETPEDESEEATPAKYRLYYTPSKSQDGAVVYDNGYLTLKPGEAQYLGRTWDTWGTTIAAVDGRDAEIHSNNNLVNSYGIWADTKLSMAENTVWGGDITVETSDVRIIADADFRQMNADGAVWCAHDARAVGNEIGAYGVRSDGVLEIAKMDGLRSDDALAGNGKGAIQYAVISATANDNLLSVYATPGGSDPAIGTGGVDITAAALYAATLKLGSVSENVQLTAESSRNYLKVRGGATASLSGTNGAYGIYANNAAFGSFRGRITVTNNSNESSCTISANNKVTKLGVGIRVTGKLSTTENLGGTIYVEGNNDLHGIYAKNISVTGVIDTEIRGRATNLAGAVTGKGGFGIWADSVNAAAFTGKIDALYGINVSGTFSTDVTDDPFDVAGTIIASGTGSGTGVISGGKANLRVSGTIHAATAILTDGYYIATSSDNPNARWMVNSQKHADTVELAASADVRGVIDLGDGEINTLILSNAATFVGTVQRTTARLNMYINLEDSNVPDDHTTITVSGDDMSFHPELFTLTVNLNYAEAGEQYSLYRYNSGTYESTMEYWVNQQISFHYQGCAGSLTLTVSANDPSSLVGTAEVKDAYGVTYATVTGTFKNDASGHAAFSVTVDSITAGKAPKDLVLVYGVVGEDNPATNFVGRAYDKDKKALTLDWSRLQPAEYENYGLLSLFAYEVEYILYDQNGDKLGESIVARVKTTDGSKLVINGVENNTKIEWRMRILGDDSANIVTKWSDWETIDDDQTAVVNTHVAPLSSRFGTAQVATKAIDASPNPGVTGIVSAVADLSWDKIGSEAPVRNYIVEYVQLDQQITLNNLTENITLDEYIAGNGAQSLFVDAAAAGKTIYRKVVTGTQVSVSGFQNAAFVYWRLKAVDSLDSDTATDTDCPWVAGDTFRVWTNTDSVAPVFKNITIGYQYKYDFPEEVTEPAQLAEESKIYWSAANDSESGVAHYLVEFSTDRGKSYNDWATVTAESLHTQWATAQEGYKDNFDGGPYQYDYYLDFRDIVGKPNNGTLDFRITAVDYFGRKSDPITGQFVADGGDPTFPGKIDAETFVDYSDPADVKITPTIFWEPADDGDGLGVRYYTVQLRKIEEKGGETVKGAWETIATITDQPDEYGNYIVPSADPAGMPQSAGQDTKDDKVFFFVTGKAKDAGRYEYQVIAYDYFGRTGTTYREASGDEPDQQAFGDDDMNAPTGKFNDTSFVAQVHATFGTKEVTTTTTDAQGNTTTTVTEEPDPGKVVDAVVTLSWDDTFVDDKSGLLYKVILQNDDYQPTKSYSFWTTAEEAAGKAITFSNNVPGRPVSVFESLKDPEGNIWWRVEAYDTNYNRAGNLSKRYSFAFVDEATGLPVVNSEAPAVPTAIKLTQKFDKDTQHYTDDIALQWQSANTLLGIYSYTITLTGKNYSYTKNTADDRRERMTNDMSPKVKVTDNGSYCTLKIENLKDFFGVDNLMEDDYVLTITANDAGGKSSTGTPGELLLDVTPPAAVDFSTVRADVTPNNDSNSCTITLSWDAVPDASGIAYYVIQRKEGDAPWSGAEEIRVVGKTSYSEVLGLGHAGCSYRIFAVDNAGNRGDLWHETQSVEAVPTPDRYVDSLTADVGQVFFDVSGRAIASDSVGQADPADVFYIQTGEKTVSLNCTAEGLANIPTGGTSKTIKVDIYEGDNTSKIWKTYTVKDDGRVFSSLLLQAGTKYTFKVANTDKRSVSSYTLVLDKTDLKGNNADDTYARAAANDYRWLVAGDAGDSVSFTDWVGFGDTSDVRILDLAQAGLYSFTLSGVAQGTKFTLYEMDTATGKPKSLAALSATEANTSGVTTKGLLLDNTKTYYLQVVPAQATAVGSDYKVTADILEAYPAPTTDDDFCDENAPSLDRSEKGEPLNPKTGLVSFTDLTDFYRIKVDEAGRYTVRLTGTSGKNICAAIGYVDAKGSFKTLLVKSGADKTDTLVLSREFTQKELDTQVAQNPDDPNIFYVKIYTNGATANSPYSVSFIKNEDIAVFNNDDDRILTQKQEDAAVAKGETLPVYGTLDGDGSVSDWVGLGDAEDYWVADLNGATGLYTLDLSGAENPLKMTLYQVKRDAQGGITAYTALKTVSATAVNASVSTGAVLLNAGAEYRVGVVGTGAKSGQNSYYTLALPSAAVTVALGNPTGDETYALAEAGCSVTAGVNKVFIAPKHDDGNGGAYRFAVDAGAVTGSVKLTVYELLDTGATRTVKSITVKAGAVGDTGYLFFDSQAVKNGTGIYQLEVKAADAKSSGTFDLSVGGYQFAQYLAGKDAPIVLGEKNWVGIGDPTDEYDFAPAEDGVRSLFFDGIDGSNIKITVLENGKSKKTFTPAANSTSASLSYNFTAGNSYVIQVASADNGKSKFSEYTMNMVSRQADVERKDNSFQELGSQKKPSDTGAPVASFDNGWVGLGDAVDYFRLDVAESGNFELAIENISNDVKLTLLEAKTWNDNGSVKTAATVQSITAKAVSGNGVIGNLCLDSAKEYYVMVQAAGVDGTKDTEYSWNLNPIAAVAQPGTSGTIGVGNVADYFQFTAVDGATSVSLALTDQLTNTVLTLWQVADNGKYTKVTSLTASAKTPAISTGNLCLAAGGNYVVELTLPKVDASTAVDYDLVVSEWKFADFVTPDNTPDTASVLAVGMPPVSSAVWSSGDNCDYYTVGMVDGGSYTLDLSGFDGAKVKVSLGTLDAKGTFKALQTVTGKAGAASVLLSRKLDAGTAYYVKVEAVGKNVASQYTVSLVNNSARAGFSNADDTWKLVAADSGAVRYGAGDEISNWVGFGDAVDCFKVYTDKNAQLTFGGNDAGTMSALTSKEITLALFDENGKAVACDFDKTTGLYTSKTILMADREYYLSVTSAKPAEKNTDYGIAIGRIL